MMDKEIKLGQVWVEKNKRAEYSDKRELLITAIGEKTISEQDGITDITLINYTIGIGNAPKRLSRNTMSFHGLRKKWKLVESKTSDLPLTMGDKIVGKLSLDRETGEFHGWFDKALIGFLAEAFGSGLMEISFFGKPANPITREELHKKFMAYLTDEVKFDNNGATFRREITGWDKTNG